MAQIFDKSAFDLNVKVQELENIPDQAPKIEDKLRPKPKLSARLSARILFVAFGLVMVIFWVYMSSVAEMDARKHKKGTAEPDISEEDKPHDQYEVVKGAPKDLIDNMDSGTGNRMMTLVKPEKPKVVEHDKGMFPDKQEAQVPSIREINRTEQASEIPPMKGDKNRPQSSEDMAMQSVRQAQQKAIDERISRMQLARQGGLKLVAFGTDRRTVNTKNAENVNEQDSNSELMQSLQDLKSGKATVMAAQGVGTQGGDQEQKAAFIKNAANEPAGYHPYRTIKAASKNELKIGTYIPLILNQGINSDLPGQITARVTENVYDSITGCRLLLPAMTTVIGRYDSKIAAGQNRNLVVWNHLIFPDGGELNLGAMQGYDTNGFSGLEAETDNHFWKLFGLTLGMSTVTATVQAAVPQQNNTGNSVQNPGQLLQTQIAQQYGQLGAQIIGKQLSVQPTLKNYAGEKFIITIPHTIVMDKVWRFRCNS